MSAEKLTTGTSIDHLQMLSTLRRQPKSTIPLWVSLTATTLVSIFIIRKSFVWSWSISPSDLSESRRRAWAQVIWRWKTESCNCEVHSERFADSIMRRTNELIRLTDWNGHHEQHQAARKGSYNHNNCSSLVDNSRLRWNHCSRWRKGFWTWYALRASETPRPLYRTFENATLRYIN